MAQVSKKVNFRNKNGIPTSLGCGTRYPEIFYRKCATSIVVILGRLCLSVHSNVRAMPSRYAAGDIARPHPTTADGTQKQEKLCGRC